MFWQYFCHFKLLYIYFFPRRTYKRTADTIHIPFPNSTFVSHFPKRFGYVEQSNARSPQSDPKAALCRILSTGINGNGGDEQCPRNTRSPKSRSASAWRRT